jgi:uncharacterized protein
VFNQSVQVVEQSSTEVAASTQPELAATSQPTAATATASAPAEVEVHAKESLAGFDRFWAEIEGGFHGSGPPDLDEAEVMAYRDGPMTATLVMRGISFISMLVFAGLFGGFGFRVVGMFLIGMALMKLGFFSPAKRAWHAWCCVIGLLFGLPGEIWIVWAHHVDSYDMGWSHIGLETLHQITSFILCFGYVGLVALIVDFGLLRHVTAGFAAIGRMALTNYLLQSVIATTIMYWWGLGWFNSVSRIEQAAIVIGVFAVQVPLSLFWLKVFNMGPIEWLWRSLTYWKLQPILRRAQPDMTA